MIKLQLNDDSNRRPDSDIYRLTQLLMPPPVPLDAAPTTTGKQLPNDLDNGYFGTNWYVNLGGTVRVIAYTNV